MAVVGRHFADDHANGKDDRGVDQHRDRHRRHRFFAECQQRNGQSDKAGIAETTAQPCDIGFAARPAQPFFNSETDGIGGQRAAGHGDEHRRRGQVVRVHLRDRPECQHGQGDADDKAVQHFKCAIAQQIGAATAIAQQDQAKDRHQRAQYRYRHRRIVTAEKEAARRLRAGKASDIVLK